MSRLFFGKCRFVF